MLPTSPDGVIDAMKRFTINHVTADLGCTPKTTRAWLRKLGITAQATEGAGDGRIRTIREAEYKRLRDAFTARGHVATVAPGQADLRALRDEIDRLSALVASLQADQTKASVKTTRQEAQQTALQAGKVSEYHPPRPQAVGLLSKGEIGRIYAAHGGAQADAKEYGRRQVAERMTDADRASRNAALRFLVAYQFRTGATYRFSTCGDPQCECVMLAMEG